MEEKMAVQDMQVSIGGSNFQTKQNKKIHATRQLCHLMHTVILLNLVSWYTYFQKFSNCIIIFFYRQNMLNCFFSILYAPNPILLMLTTVKISPSNLKRFYSSLHTKYHIEIKHAHLSP